LRGECQTDAGWWGAASRLTPAVRLLAKIRETRFRENGKRVANI